jgi:hypothetical protein
VGKVYRNAPKIAKDWLRKIKKIQRLKFTIYFQMMKTLLAKKIKFKEEKFKIGCLRNQLDFVEGLIEFMEDLIARKNDF